MGRGMVGLGMRRMRMVYMEKKRQKPLKKQSGVTRHLVGPVDGRPCILAPGHMAVQDLGAGLSRASTGMKKASKWLRPN